MIIKNTIAYESAIFKKALPFDEIKGIIITAVQIEDPDRYYNNINRGGLFNKAPHFLIDNKGTVFQILPENYQTKLCGGIYDKSYIQIAIACPSWIRFNKKNGFSVPLVSEAQVQMTRAYNTLVELCTSMCISYDIEPKLGETIVDNKGIGSMENIWEGLSLKQSLKSLCIDVRDTINNGKGYYHNGIDFSYVFDPNYYARMYPEIAKDVDYNKGKLFSYFVGNGMQKCQKGNSEFDVVNYKVYNPDLVFGDDWYRYYEHYCLSGRLEGRKCL